MRAEVRERSYFWETIKTIVVAIIISLVLLLLAALLIKVLNIDDKYLSIINQVIKGLSIMIACLFGLRKPNNRWLRGLIVGFFYVIIAFFMFSAMSGKIAFGITFLNDVAIGTVAGLLSGIMAKLIRKDRI